MASPVALEAPPEAPEDNNPIISKNWSLYESLTYGTRIRAFQSLVTLGLGSLRLLKASEFKAIAPTYTKRYDIHPSLECRVFLPQNKKPDSKIPLYIDIHGGGFALCDPQTDDKYCRHMADQFGYCVVSINYRKAPAYPYPTPVNDCVDLTRAVLSDPDLPVDYNKVVLGGFSAGGNLTLATAQHQEIKDKLTALVLFYPSVDFSGRHRGEYRVDNNGKEDTLKNTAVLFNWAYVPNGQDRREKTLSPIFATREDLPQKMFFIGAEYDVLCNEASIMAKKLAGVDTTSGPDSNWDKNGIKWELIPDVQHGFTHVPPAKGKEEERRILCEDLYGRIDDWLKHEVF